MRKAPAIHPGDISEVDEFIRQSDIFYSECAKVQELNQGRSMPVAFEFKVKGKSVQYAAIDQAIKTGQFIRNKCLRLWLDVKGTTKMDLYKYCKVLAHEFPFANKLNSTARQAMSERAWSSISRFCQHPALKRRCDQSSTEVLDQPKSLRGLRYGQVFS